LRRIVSHDRPDWKPSRHSLLEQPHIVVDRVAPLVVVVRAVQRVAGGPPAARPAVVADDEPISNISHDPILDG
jgi:hypothetical protein